MVITPLPESARERLSPPPRHDTLNGLLVPEGPLFIAPSPLLDVSTRERIIAAAEAHGVQATEHAAEARTLLRVVDDVLFGDDGPARALLPQNARPPRDNPEVHALAVLEEQGRTRIVLAAPEAHGIALASRTLVQMWGEDGLAAGGVLDWPSFPLRGLVEGFYGDPWTAEARDGMLAFLGAHKCNTFVYGPKDDLYHRSAWREPYPPDAFADVERQIATCRREGLRFVYSLGPGLDLQYSSEADVQQILTKYRTLFDAGVRDFGLFFDDIPFVFLNPADAEAYGEATMDDIAPLGRAQAAVTRTVFEQLRAWDQACTLIFCPIEYFGDCDSEYVRTLGASLPHEVDIFYTGPDVCSARLDTAHTRGISERFERPVVFWDNYPVNDAAMTGRLHLNPLVGRAPDLFTVSRGLICNPMTQCEASKVAVGTIVEYAWLPERYDAEAAFRRALLTLVAPPEVEHVMRFAENMYFCCLHETESEPLQADIEALKLVYTKDARRALLQRIQDIQASCTVLERLSNPALRAEMAPWVQALSGWMEVARAALGLLESPRNRRMEERERVATARTRMAGAAEEPCAHVVAEFSLWALEQTA